MTKKSDNTSETNSQGQVKTQETDKHGGTTGGNKYLLTIADLIHHQHCRGLLGDYGDFVGVGEDLLTL